MFLFLLLILAGCNTSAGDETSAVVKNLNKPSSGSIQHPNKPAPSFHLTDNNENNFTSETLKGKVYIIQGFSPGCSSCAKEIGTLSKVYERFKGKGIEIISIDVLSEDINGAIDTKEQFNGGDWKWAFDSDEVAVKFGIATLESTYIIDKEGIIVYKDEGISSPDIIISEIEKII